MSLDQNPTYAAPDDWRAYSGVLSRRVFAFLIDYAIVLLLCIPAAVIVFFLGVITLGLGFFLYPAWTGGESISCCPPFTSCFSGSSTRF